MTESASGQNKANPALWLATRAGKVGRPWPLGISRIGPARKTCKLVRSRWLDIRTSFFFALFYALNLFNISDLAWISLVSNTKNFMFSSIYLKKMRTKPTCTPICRARTLWVGDLWALSRVPPPLFPQEKRGNFEQILYILASYPLKI